MRRFVVLILVAGLAVLSACGGSEKAGEQADTGLAVESGKPASVEEAYKVLITYLEEDQLTEDALAATLKFLDEYPESKYTEGFVLDVVYYKGEKLGDRKGAVALAEKARGRVDDPEIVLKLDKKMLVFYGDAGMKEEMLALADRMDSAGQIKFGDNWNIIEAAVEMEDWALARQYCAKTQGMATAATFRSDWPDYECTDEEAEQAGRNRKGMLLTMDSWALANQGEIDEALAGFASAKEVVSPLRGMVDAFPGAVRPSQRTLTGCLCRSCLSHSEQHLVNAVRPVYIVNRQPFSTFPCRSHFPLAFIGIGTWSWALTWNLIGKGDLS